ncbi:MAG: hypothetical protein WCH37_04275 [Synechococcaceae cyanobacterium ELA182]
MNRFLQIRFWLPLLVIAATLIIAPHFAAFQPPLQSHSLALLLSGTTAISAYLFTVIAYPEKF